MRNIGRWTALKTVVLIAICACFAERVAATGKQGSHKADGTNVWIGASSGGSMKALSNWKAIVGGVEYADATSVSNLFMQHVALDLRSLANGAVLTNDIAFGNTYKENNSSSYTMLAGLVVSGNADDTWTITRSSEGKGFWFCFPSYLTVDGGTLLWSDSGATGFYPTKGPHKLGSGRLVFEKIPYFWESTGYVDGGSLVFTNGTGTTTFCWKVAPDATIAVENGVSQFSQIFTASSAATANLSIAPESTLVFNTGFNNYNSGNCFYGDIVGTGCLRVTGGGAHYLRRSTAGALSFLGRYEAILGEIVFGTTSVPVGIQSSTALEVNGTGRLRFFDDTTAALLSGTGVDGGVALPAGRTLTVAGPATNAATVFSGRIDNGGLVKQGANYTLALAGTSRLTGPTRVEAGTLTVQRGFSREGLRAYWNFEDADNMGADVSTSGLLPLAIRTNWTCRPTLVDDGVLGRALHFGGTNATLTQGGQFYRADSNNLSKSSVAVLPSGNMPFTFSFWMRPKKGKCGIGTNFIHVDGANTSVTNESGGVSYGPNWGNGFFFGSVRRDQTTPSQELSAFQNLGFYCGMSWTRSGNWQDNGSAELGGNRVAIAKFDDANYLFDGAWHHVVGTYSNRVIRIFVDGTKRDEVTKTWDLNVSSNPYLQVGSYSAGDGMHCYQGDLDEIQWFAGAWSEADVAAEYAARNPQRNASVLPEPVAHWTFDAMKADRGFADVTGHGYDLENVPSNNTKYVETEAVTYADDATVVGNKAAVIKTRTSYLRLPADNTLTNRLPEGSSFTLTMRCAYPANGTFFLLGNGTDANSVRLKDSGCPRVHSWMIGSSTTYEMKDSCVYGSSGSFPQSAYCLNTLVYDADRKIVRYYRGAQLLSSSSLTFTLKATTLQWGNVGSSYFTQLRLDDLRLYNTALTPAQVAALAGAVRYGGIRTDAETVDTPTLATNQTLAVASSALLEVGGVAHERVAAITGAGTVKIRGGATFETPDYSGFTGTVTGGGQLLVQQGQTIPLVASQIASDVGFADNTVVVSSATKTTPLVKTSGRVVLPQNGVIRLSDATSVGSFAGKRFLLAECASASFPTNLSGWVLQPSGDNSPNLAFVLTEGKLYATFNGGGTLVLFR